jgi:pyridoxal phosphate-dependent aminotransferase EpsN
MMSVPSPPLCVITPTLPASVGAPTGNVTRPRGVLRINVTGVLSAETHRRFRAACERHGVPLVEDAAEALGSSYRGRTPGTRGRFGAFSFNGNKIITTSGGGMLVSADGKEIERARLLAAQARDPASYYQHSTVGFNYRMSNVLAAIGRGQLRVLPARVAARRRNFALYAEALGSVPGLRLMPEAPYGRASRWLSVAEIDPAEFGATAEDVRRHLETGNIESRRVWKPMHLQPLFARARRVGGAVSERLFRNGLCLPSGSALTDAERARVVETLLATPRTRVRRTGRGMPLPSGNRGRVPASLRTTP